MATKQDLAKGYVERLLKSEFSKETVDSIIIDIKNIIYEESGNKISIADRIDIVTEIKKLLRTPGLEHKTRTFSKGGKILEQSNDDFLDLIDYVLDNVKK